MGLFDSPEAFKGQDYTTLKKSAEESGQLFEDKEFPAVYESLFYTPGKLTNVEWKRPGEITSEPRLFVEGSSSGDVSQGSLGNCWLVAATSVLATKDSVLKKVIPDPDEQEWNEKNKYAGIFHFHFWQFGEWIDVVIDDRLPTVNGELVFIHSQARNEFWSALLEKAYAKVHGCYEVLDGGNLAEALVDFTGGVAEPIDLVEASFNNHAVEKEEFFAKMKDSHEHDALLAAAITAKSPEEMEKKLDNGLVMGHAYGITAVKRIATGESTIFNFWKRDKIEMIRLRNPWGQKEWNGAFSDGDERWNKISQSEKDKIGLTFEDDGEFWMLYDDFVTAFTNVAICRVVNTAFFSFDRNFFEYSFRGSWVRPDRAGGCTNNKETFLKNPQFAFTTIEDDDNGEVVLMSLQQKDRRSERKEGEKNLTIGFNVFKVEKNRRTIAHEKGKTICSSTYINSRSVFLRHRFPPGRYVIVPCTFEPGQEGEFLLRIYTDKKGHAMELTLDHPLKSWYHMCGPDYQCALRIKIVSAVGLEKQDSVGGADPYCIVKCEKGVFFGGEAAKTKVVSDNLNPGFDEEFIFYRRFPAEPLTVQVWNHNVIKDSYMGKATFPCPITNDKKTYHAELFGRWREKNVQKPGKVTVEVTCVSDMFRV